MAETKIINGETRYFLAGYGYVSKADYMKTKAYEHFMFNPENIGNCAECPENVGSPNGFPCGQQHCWVTCHCEQIDY